MALPEACGVWIEQRVQESLDAGDGKSLRAIGREVAKEVEKYFKVKVNPETMKTKVLRIKAGSNEPPQPTN